MHALASLGGCGDLRRNSLGLPNATAYPGLTDRWREFHGLADLRSAILAETGAFREARPFRAGSYRERTPLMHEIRRDGVDL